MAEFRCSCGAILSELPLAWHFGAPAQWPSIPPEERELTSDQCMIDAKYFFVRGLIEIPVVDGDHPFAWGVWVSLSETNFDRAGALWENPNRINEPPYFGWLSNSLPGYPDTMNLKAAVHSRRLGIRPYIEL